MSKKKKMKKNRKNSNAVKWVLLLILAALLAFMIYVARNPGYFFSGSDLTETVPSEVTSGMVSDWTEKETDSEMEATLSIQIDQIRELPMDLGNGLVITDIGKYTGIYMEDGTDELLSGILMMVVTNTNDVDLQYAEIELILRDGSASFSLTTLPAGASAVLLEMNRMEYDSSEPYDNAVTNHVAWFSEPLSLHEDRIQIQALDGVMNISNISDADITGDIVIYYKNCSADMFYGGITYRVRITGGLGTGEIRQIKADHFSENGSKVMFVTCG